MKHSVGNNCEYRKGKGLEELCSDHADCVALPIYYLRYPIEIYYIIHVDHSLSDLCCDCYAGAAKRYCEMLEK